MAQIQSLEERQTPATTAPVLMSRIEELTSSTQFLVMWVMRVVVVVVVEGGGESTEREGSGRMADKDNFASWPEQSE